uniref:Serine/arginine repetitive matrix protein 3-like n=1 Tax=Castor canadensis TaxID=51338 RepID=A0A8B7TKK9_CASCN|nr:serine/arginine repetitive matrix protein 3-like [Castor canadensis]
MDCPSSPHLCRGKGRHVSAHPPAPPQQRGPRRRVRLARLASPRCSQMRPPLDSGPSAGTCGVASPIPLLPVADSLPPPPPRGGAERPEKVGRGGGGSGRLRARSLRALTAARGTAAEASPGSALGSSGTCAWRGRGSRGGESGAREGAGSALLQRRRRRRRRRPCSSRRPNDRVDAGLRKWLVPLSVWKLFSPCSPSRPPSPPSPRRRSGSRRERCRASRKKRHERLISTVVTCMSSYEQVTGRSFGDKDFRTGLENGILLCELLNAIKPGLVKKINRLPTPIAGLVSIENCDLFPNIPLLQCKGHSSVIYHASLLHCMYSAPMGTH